MSGSAVMAYSVNRRGLSTGLCGALVLSTNIEDVGLPVLTLWGLSVRSSNIQLQFMPRMLTFQISFMGERDDRDVCTHVCPWHEGKKNVGLPADGMC